MTGLGYCRLLRPDVKQKETRTIGAHPNLSDFFFQLSLVFIFPFSIRFLPNNFCWQKGGTGVEDPIVKQALLLSINLHPNGNTSFYSNIMELSKSYNLPNFVPNNLDKTKISRYKGIM